MVVGSAALEAAQEAAAWREQPRPGAPSGPAAVGRLLAAGGVPSRPEPPRAAQSRPAGAEAGARPGGGGRGGARVSELRR